ncbi:unnamed protein product [Mytilus coruscus]|uniref:Uncharacterized protein n=1 Tax=Mytilus coruscus TaxID=42192 RepID=A0A6J7ZZ18_MYTCO|nr:unnamed protein product [Mytilus coruscus]
MSEDEKKTVYEFWLSPSISRPTGNKKDIKRVRLGPKIYSSHMMHVLNKSQTEAFLEFRTTNPDIKITQRKFENMKPYFVQAARQQDRSTCCCRYHIEARSIFKKCMEFRTNVLTNHDVADSNQIKVFETLSDLINSTLCEKESQEENHKMECLDRNCNNCENYRCFDKTEIQSSYFARLEISIHVTSIYRHAILEIDGEESTDDNPSIVTEHFYSREDIGFQEYFRNRFETSHAKGPQDAAGGFVKRQADIAVLRGKVNTKTAEDMYQFAIKNLTKPNESANCKRRLFRLLDTIERDEPKRFKPLTDNRSIHRVHCVENGIISVKRLSCYSCDSCLNGNYSSCQNCHIIGMKRRITMTKKDEPNRETDFEAEDETEIKDLVNRGCIIAVVADDPNNDYFFVEIMMK